MEFWLLHLRQREYCDYFLDDFDLTSRSDQAGRSVPALGRGAITVAREVPSKYPMPILDLEYRSRQLEFRRNQITNVSTTIVSSTTSTYLVAVTKQAIPLSPLDEVYSLASSRNSTLVLDLFYGSRQLEFRCKQISLWLPCDQVMTSTRREKLPTSRWRPNARRRTITRGVG